MNLLRRNSTATTEQADQVDTEPAVTDRTQGKGRPTPKRKERERRRSGPPSPPPMNRKEALKRAKERQASGQAESRVEARERMMNGEEAYLMARDRGPVRRSIRDLVDTRHGIASWFLVVGFAIVLGSYSQSPTIRLLSTALWGVLFIGLAIDWFFLARKIRALVRDRFPNDRVPMRSHIFYGVMRSAQFRRLRVPRPQVTYRQRV